MSGRRGAAVVVGVVAVFATMLGGAQAAVQVSPGVLVSIPGHGMGEFAAARSPIDENHLIVGAMDWDDEAGSVACATFVSHDGGVSWQAGSRIPGLDEGYGRADPWVTIDPAGRAHLQCMQIDADIVAYGVGSVDGTTGRPTVKQMHTRSDDGGTTWRAARRIPPKDPLNQVDKEAIYASRAGTLFACINDYPRGEGGDALVVSRSFDGGDTWMAPKALDEVIGIDSPAGTGFGNCNGFAEGPGGVVYMAWAGLFATEPTQRFGVAYTSD
ncbi:MAG: sialidase family protein, partial [Actinomycetota bacterium]